MVDGGLTHGIGNLYDGIVTGGVSVGVIDLFEAIQIHRNTHHHLMIFLTAVVEIHDIALHTETVVEFGQFIADVHIVKLAEEDVFFLDQTEVTDRAVDIGQITVEHRLLRNTVIGLETIPFPTDEDAEQELTCMVVMRHLVKVLIPLPLFWL